jgi:hypothetical protein
MTRLERLADALGREPSGGLEPIGARHGRLTRIKAPN